MCLRAGGTLLDFLAPCRNSVQLKPRFFLCLKSAFVGTAQQGNIEAQVNLPLENVLGLSSCTAHTSAFCLTELVSLFGFTGGKGWPRLVWLVD